MSERKPAAAEISSRRTRARKGQGLSVLEDIGTIISHSQTLQETFDNLVRIVAERMSTEVCSLYLFDPKDELLTLWATVPPSGNRRRASREHGSRPVHD